MHSPSFHCLLVALACSLFVGSASASEVEQALGLITKTAADLCPSVPFESYSSSEKIEGEVNGSLAGLAKKFTDLGLKGSGAFVSEQTKGIIQKDLTLTLKNVQECRLTVFQSLVRILVTSKAQIGDDISEGFLIPGQSDTPVSSCGPTPSGALDVIIGNNNAVANVFPHTVLTLAGQPVIVLNKINEKISLDLSLVGRDGRPIVSIKANHFIINTNNAYGLSRPNKSELIVTKNGETVLSISFLNESSVRIYGIFEFKNTKIVMDGSGLHVGTNTFTAGCLSFNRSDFSFQ